MILCPLLRRAYSVWFITLPSPFFSCLLLASSLLPPLLTVFPFSIFPLVLYSWPIPFLLLVICLPSLSLLSQPISASYEVWKMIVCRMKWTEFAGVMAWQNESWPSSPSITTPRRLLAYWLLVVTTKCLIQCLWRCVQREGREFEKGGWQRVEGNAGSCSTLKNPPLIDFKWWNIDFCLVQGPAELAATICRRYNAGHPFLLATISHTDTGKNEEGGKGGKGGEK